MQMPSHHFLTRQGLGAPDRRYCCLLTILRNKDICDMMQILAPWQYSEMAGAASLFGWTSRRGLTVLVFVCWLTSSSCAAPVLPVLGRSRVDGAALAGTRRVLRASIQSQSSWCTDWQLPCQHCFVGPFLKLWLGIQFERKLKVNHERNCLVPCQILCSCIFLVLLLSCAD